MSNLKKNSRMFVPYLLTCIISVSMYYVICSLSVNPNMSMMFGGAQMQALLQLGTFVVAFFVVIFLFYTNSFLMKRRKKEFGVFNILGMEKRHIVIVIGLETLFTACMALITGIITGIAVERVLFIILSSMMQIEIPLQFHISVPTILMTLLLFLVIYLLIFINSGFSVRLSNPIDLLHGASYGEKEPKTKWLMTLLGLATLAGGYGIAVTVKNPLSAFLLFFLAVILVVIATYLLFTSGSITVLKLLKKNKSFYYRVGPFVNISTMIYRMKQNAVGLANICILSTMVLVMLSTTISLWVGMDDTVETCYPREMNITSQDISEDQLSRLDLLTQETCDELGLQRSSLLGYSYLSFSALQTDDDFSVNIPQDHMESLDHVVHLFFMTVEDYNKNADQDKTLNKGEVLLYTDGQGYENEQFRIGDSTFKVKEKLDSFIGTANMTGSMVPSYFVVVENDAIINDLYQMQFRTYQSYASEVKYFTAFDTDGDREQNKKLFDELNLKISSIDAVSYVESKSYSFESFFSLYAGFLFIGIFLSILFVMTTILILYYKQISEGFEDKKRFEIMQKVGLDHREVRRIIHAQVLMVFFLPLAVAGIHIVFAFPIVNKLLQVLSMMNSSLYAKCTLICFLVFAFIYSLIYLLTSKVYYGIVRREE